MSFTHFIYVGLMCFHSFLRARFQWFYLEFQVFSWHLWHYEVIKRLPKVDVKRNMKDFLFHNCVVKYIVFWGGLKFQILPLPIFICFQVTSHSLRDAFCKDF